MHHHHHHHHHHQGVEPVIAIQPYNYGPGYRPYSGTTVIVGNSYYGNPVLRKRCYVALGIVFLIVSAILLIFGALSLAGVFGRSFSYFNNEPSVEPFPGAPLLAFGGMSLLVSVSMFASFCCVRMQENYISQQQQQQQQQQQMGCEVPYVIPGQPTTGPPFHAPNAPPFQTSPTPAPPPYYVSSTPKEMV